MIAQLDAVDRRRLRTRVLVLVAAAFVVGMAVRGVVGKDSAEVEDRLADAPAAEVTDGAGPTGTRDGMPVGFAQTDDGARAAAAAYVLTGQDLLAMPPTRVGDAITAIAAAASAETQIADAEQQLEQLRAVLAGGNGPIRYLQAVLATRVDAYASERARVSVWSVGVLSRAGAAQPQAGWNISTFELVWERGDWKVWSETITSGPAPALDGGAAPASHDELDRALNGFVPWETD